MKKPADTAKEVLAIGDSVMLDISSHLRQSFSNVTIDGKVGRQMSQALELAREYKSFNQPNKAVIIELEPMAILQTAKSNNCFNLSQKLIFILSIHGFPANGKAR